MLNRDDSIGNMRPIPVGSDQLTAERIRGAHMSIIDGETPEERLEGLFAMIEDFHEKMNFLRVGIDAVKVVRYELKKNGFVQKLIAVFVINAMFYVHCQVNCSITVLTISLKSCNGVIIIYWQSLAYVHIKQC
jgi:hypothetical protein